MCVQAALAALGPLFGTGATAAGATAAASAASTGLSLGTVLQTAGMIASVGGSIAQGIAASKAAKTQAELIEQQAATEKQLNATEDNRRRALFRTQIAQQRAELASRGIQLDSPTALLLGQTAAQEMSFESQSVRQAGYAKQQELSYAAKAARADAANSLLKGFTTAAGSFVTSAIDIWPGLKTSTLSGTAT